MQTAWISSNQLPPCTLPWQFDRLEGYWCLQPQVSALSAQNKQKTHAAALWSTMFGLFQRVIRAPAVTTLQQNATKHQPDTGVWQCLPGFICSSEFIRVHQSSSEFIRLSGLTQYLSRARRLISCFRSADPPKHRRSSLRWPMRCHDPQDPQVTGRFHWKILEVRGKGFTMVHRYAMLRLCESHGFPACCVSGSNVTTLRPLLPACEQMEALPQNITFQNRSSRPPL